MAQPVDIQALESAIADTLTMFLEDHSYCANAEVIVDRCNGRTFVFVNRDAFEITIVAPEGMS